MKPSQPDTAESCEPHPILESLDQLQTEFMRLKAIEQAAIDFRKSVTPRELPAFSNLTWIAYVNLDNLLPIE